MPARDRTGPDGFGPGTGRGLGGCVGPDKRRGLGRRFVRPRYGRGMGFGYGRRPVAAEPVYEDQDLTEDVVQDELDQIEIEEKRLAREKEYLKKQLDENKGSE